MLAQHKTELSKELYFKTVTFNFIITFLIFFSLCLNIMPWTILSSCQCSKCWKSECFTSQCFAMAQPLGLHMTQFVLHHIVLQKSFSRSCLMSCVSMDFQDAGRWRGGLTLWETAKPIPQAELLLSFLGQALPSFLAHQKQALWSFTCVGSFIDCNGIAQVWMNWALMGAVEHSMENLMHSKECQFPSL